MKKLFILILAIGSMRPAAAQIAYSLVAIENSSNAAVPIPNLSQNLLHALSSSGQALILGNTPDLFENALVEGLWVGAPGAMQVLALDGMPAPGAEADAVFRIFDNSNFQTQATDYSISSSGQVVLRAELIGSATQVNNLGVWVGTPGALKLVARKGSPAPGTEADTLFGAISPGSPVGLPGPSVNTSGQVAFAATLSGPSAPAGSGGIWAGTPGDLKLLLRQNISINPLINDSGEIAYWSGAGIFMGTPGAVQLRVPFGVAPGLTGVTNQAVLGQVALNNGGHVAFITALSGTVATTNNRALWRGGSGTLNLIARTGTQAAGLNGVVFTDFPTLINLAVGAVPLLNDADQVAFVAKLGGPGVTVTNDNSIWISDSTGLQLVAREGDLAPGAGDGVRFSSLNAQPALNDKGQLAFLTILNGPGVTGTNNTAIYVGKPGALQIVARTGLQVDVGSGVNGYISNIRTLYTGLGNPHGGHSAGLGSGGEVLFSASILNQVLGGLRNAVLLAAPARDATGNAFPIISINKFANDVVMRFVSESGKHYGLEYTEQLGPATWIPLPGETIASTTEASITDSSAGKGAKRFYRVRQL